MAKTPGCLLALWLAALPAWGQAGRVEAIQYPAWLERGGHAVPLAPDTRLQPGDAIRTGAHARVVVRLVDGSTVKLGENARVVIERGGETGRLFKAAFSVVAGAFRFTSHPARPRDIAIRMRVVTARVGDTDIWARSTDERDLVCLVAGRVEITTEGHPPASLDQPLDCYQRARDGSPPRLAQVDPAQLETWSAETGIPADGATARGDGKWRVVAAVFPDRDKALAFSRTLRARGYPAQVAQRERGFGVQVPGLVGEREARALMARMREIPGVRLPQVMAPS